MACAAPYSSVALCVDSAVVGMANGEQVFRVALGAAVLELYDMVNVRRELATNLAVLDVLAQRVVEQVPASRE
jgi:hypothetical protein